MTGIIKHLHVSSSIPEKSQPFLPISVIQHRAEQRVKNSVLFSGDDTDFKYRTSSNSEQNPDNNKTKNKSRNRKNAKRLGLLALLGSMVTVASGNTNKIPGVNHIPDNPVVETLNNIDLFDFDQIIPFIQEQWEQGHEIIKETSTEVAANETPINNPTPETPVDHDTINQNDNLDDVVIPEGADPLEQDETINPEAEPLNEGNSINGVPYLTLEETEQGLRDVFEFSYFAPNSNGNFQEYTITPEAETLQEPVIQRIAWLIQKRPDILDSLQAEVQSNIVQFDTQFPPDPEHTAPDGRIRIMLYEGSGFNRDGEDSAGLFSCQTLNVSRGDVLVSTHYDLSIILSTDDIPDSINKLNTRGLSNFPAYDIVTHEFMHLIEALKDNTQIACDGDGIPPGLNETQKNAYIEARELEKEKIKNDDSLLRDYALKNDSEFWTTLTEVYAHQPDELLNDNEVLFRTAEIVFNFNPIETPVQATYPNSDLNPANLSLEDLNPDEFMTFKYFTADSSGVFRETSGESEEAQHAKNVFISRLFGMLQNRPDWLLKMQVSESPAPTVNIYETNGNVNFADGGKGDVRSSSYGFSITTGALDEVLDSPDNSFDRIIWLLTNTIDTYESEGHGLFTQNFERDGLLPGWTSEEEIQFIESRERIRHMTHDGSYAHHIMQTSNDSDFLTAVVTNFFEQPHELKSIDGNIYQILVDTFRLDPIETPVFPYV